MSVYFCITKQHVHNIKYNIITDNRDMVNAFHQLLNQLFSYQTLLHYKKNFWIIILPMYTYSLKAIHTIFFIQCQFPHRFQAKIVIH